MDNEMIERICRILCIEDENNPDATLSGDGINFQWKGYQSATLKILKAMREPTEKMIDAGENTFMPPDYASSEHCWQSMIDAILND